MTSSRMGKAATALLALVSALPTASFALLALTLGVIGQDHAHHVSVVTEEGHLHLVLGHDKGVDHHHAGSSHHDERSGSFSENDHVFDLTSGDAVSFAGRRAIFAPIPALALPAVLAPFPIARSHVRPPPEPRARGADLVKITVLRL